MPTEYQFENEQQILSTVSESAYALFASAATSEEMASLRDEVLRRVSEVANMTRNRLAEERQRVRPTDGSSLLECTSGHLRPTRSSVFCSMRPRGRMPPISSGQPYPACLTCLETSAPRNATSALPESARQRDFVFLSSLTA